MTQSSILNEIESSRPPDGLPPQPRGKFFLGLFRRFRGLQAVTGLVGIILIAIVVSPHDRSGTIIFLKSDNLTNIVRQVAEIGIIALAMTFVILTGGIDLSVGSMLALGACVTAMVLTRTGAQTSFGLHIAVAILAALAATGAAGLLNGLVISRLSIQPFIVTLAAMMGVRGLARWLTDNTNIDFGFGHEVSAVFANTFSQKWLVIGCFVILAGIFSILLRQTVFGRYVRATGDNEKAAAYAGLPINRTKLWVYFLSGLMCGLAGVLHAAQVRQGNPNDGVAYELDAIAAVVIGGTSLSGGRGTIFGTIIGTLIMGILTNILQLKQIEIKQIDSNMQLMVKAVIIILAVWAQSRRRTT